MVFSKRHTARTAPQGHQRRAWLLLALAGGALALAGCGFAMPRTQRLAFDAVRVQGGSDSGVTRELRQTLERTGVQVFTSVSSAGDATEQAVLDVLTDQREKAVVGTTAAGQVRELQLRTRFRFQLRSVQGQQLLAPTELLLERDISFTETTVLAKSAEEALMYRDMQTDIVQQVMRRLAAVSAR